MKLTCPGSREHIGPYKTEGVASGSPNAVLTRVRIDTWNETYVPGAHRTQAAVGKGPPNPASQLANGAHRPNTSRPRTPPCSPPRQTLTHR